MPRYRSRSKRPFKAVKSAKSLSKFLQFLTPEQYNAFQEYTKTHTDPDVFQGAIGDVSTATKTQLIHGIFNEEKAKHTGQPVGGGLGDAITSAAHSIWDVATTVVPPLQGVTAVYNTIANSSSHVSHDTEASAHTSQVASFVKNAYSDAPENEKANYIGGYTRDQALSENKYVEVWNNEDTQHTIVAVRGTKPTHAEDVAQDVGILTAGRPKDTISDDLAKIVAKYGENSTLEIAGHSLGAALIAASFLANPSLEPEFDRIDFYNPGTSAVATSNAVNEISQDNVYYYLNSVDVVGWGALTQSNIPNDHMIVNGPQGLSPMTNHAIDQWL